MWRATRTRLIQRVVQTTSRVMDPERVLKTLTTVQEFRTFVEEAQNAVLHFTMLPTRYDVRKIHRRVLAVRRRSRELELALTRLEAAQNERRSQ